MLIEDPEQRARARTAIIDIAQALAALPLEHADSDTLVDGAVLRTYLAADDTLADDDDVAGRAIHAAIAKIPELRRASLYGGVARIGWTIAHVVDAEEADVACAPLDEALRAVIAGGGVPDYDLIGGIVGIGVYALERGEAGRPIAEVVLDELERRARPYGGGIGWHTEPALLPEHQRELAPEGYWNLGVAHGIPGAIALLARFAAAGIAPERSRRLLDGAVALLLGAAPAANAPRFQAWLPDRSPAGRIAWCYGDLGIAAVLLGLPEPAWRAEGLALARACATRIADPMLRDASLCHGTAGAAHVFHRMALATGEPALADAARTLFARTLEQRRDEPIAGFPFWSAGDHYAADASLLQGAAGVALALHAAISDIEPAWDRLLLCDLVPRQGDSGL